MLRIFVALPLLFVLSAAATAGDITVDRDGSALIVRSPVQKGNFLFRVEGGFRQNEKPQKPFCLELDASEGEQTAEIRLHLEEGVAGTMEELLKRRNDFYASGLKDPGKPEIAGRDGRRTVVFRTKQAFRTVLVVRDAARLYELFLDETPKEGPFHAPLASLIDGFTVLEPKGPVADAASASPEALKAKRVSQDFYNIELLKPQGFLEKEVDPRADKGIIYHFRRHGESTRICEIYVRAFLAKATKEGAEARAKDALKTFADRYHEVHSPRRPRHLFVSGAKSAWRLHVTGVTPDSAVIVKEDRWFVEHENGWIYDLQVVAYGDSATAFKKEIAAFFKSVKFRRH